MPLPMSRGVAVGHCTIIKGDAVRTGVTAILPHQGNIFKDKVPAAVEVINGFGKAAGLTQINELGELETPIILTNTLSVGLALDALVEYKLKRNPEIGLTGPAVNGVVAECNDGYLNDIRGRHVQKEHVWEAIASASCEPPAEGSVGAGTGMKSFGCKSGIGTSSRHVEGYLLGVLVLSNFGKWEQLKIAGVPVGRLLEKPGVAGEMKRAPSSSCWPPMPPWTPAGLSVLPAGPDLAWPAPAPLAGITAVILSSLFPPASNTARPAAAGAASLSCATINLTRCSKQPLQGLQLAAPDKFHGSSLPF
jgi:hypothetical protein